MSEEYMLDIARTFSRVLSALLADTEQTVGQLDVLSERNRELI